MSTCQYCGWPYSQCQRRPCPAARQNQIYAIAIALLTGEWVGKR